MKYRKKNIKIIDQKILVVKMDFREVMAPDSEIWKQNLIETINFLEKEKRKPQQNKKDEKYLKEWLDQQKSNYKNHKHIMKNEDIRKQFENLMAKFPTFFRTNEEVWKNNLRETIKFLEKHKRRPNVRKQEERYLGRWLDTQVRLYKSQKNIMKNEDLRKEFQEFCKEFQLNLF